MIRKLLVVTIVLVLFGGSAMSRELTLRELGDREICTEIQIAARTAIEYKKVLFYSKNENYKEALLVYLEKTAPIVFDLVNSDPLSGETEEAFEARAVSVCFETLNSR
jgi:hypothetical protein